MIIDGCVDEEDEQVKHGWIIRAVEACRHRSYWQQYAFYVIYCSPEFKGTNAQQPQSFIHTSILSLVLLNYEPPRVCS